MLRKKKQRYYGPKTKRVNLKHIEAFDTAYYVYGLVTDEESELAQIEQNWRDFGDDHLEIYFFKDELMAETNVWLIFHQDWVALMENATYQQWMQYLNQHPKLVMKGFNQLSWVTKAPSLETTSWFINHYFKKHYDNDSYNSFVLKQGMDNYGLNDNYQLICRYGVYNQPYLNPSTNLDKSNCVLIQKETMQLQAYVIDIEYLHALLDALSICYHKNTYGFNVEEFKSQLNHVALPAKLLIVFLVLFFITVAILVGYHKLAPVFGP